MAGPACLKESLLPDAQPAAAAVAEPVAGGQPEFLTVARISDVDPGRARVIYLRGTEIALFNVNGTFYAVDNLCPHEGGPLVAGTVKGEILTCPWHRWQFHLGTGCSPVNPALKVPTYPVKIEGDLIKIGIISD